MNTKYDWNKIKKLGNPPTAPKAARIMPVPFKEVLDEFVNELKNLPGVHAELREAGISRFINAWSLITRPKYHLHEETIMLTFAVYPKEVKLLGEDKIFRTPEALQNFLISFTTDEKISQFGTTLQIYAERSKEDIFGSLRTKSLWTFDKADVPVIVPLSEHIRIVNSYIKKSKSIITLQVDLDNSNGFAPFAAKTTYKYLESAGYGLILTDKPKYVSNKKLSIEGRSVSSNDIR